MNIQETQKAIINALREDRDFFESTDPVSAICKICFICEQVNPDCPDICYACPVHLIEEGCKANKYFGTTEALNLN